MVKYSTRAVKLDQTFSALADATRRRILDRVAERPRTLSDLAAPIEMSLPAVLKHVRVLESAGLVRCRKQGRQVWCSIDMKGVDTTLGWLQDRRKVWVSRLDRLEGLLERTDP